MAPSTVWKVDAPALMKSWFLIRSVVAVAFIFFPFPTVGIQQKLCSVWSPGSLLLCAYGCAYGVAFWWLNLQGGKKHRILLLLLARLYFLTAEVRESRG